MRNKLVLTVIPAALGPSPCLHPAVTASSVAGRWGCGAGVAARAAASSHDQYRDGYQ